MGRLVHNIADVYAKYFMRYLISELTLCALGRLPYILLGFVWCRQTHIQSAEESLCGSYKSKQRAEARGT